MKSLKRTTKVLRCYKMLSIDEDNRTFETVDDIKWLLETDSIYFSEKGHLKVDEYTSYYDYVDTYYAEVGDYIAITGHHEDGEPTVKLLKRHDADRNYEVAELKLDTRSHLQKIYEMFEDNELDEWDKGYLEGLEFAMGSIDKLDDSLLSEAKRITDSYKKGANINEKT